MSRVRGGGDVVVFLGPSLPRAAARALLEARYLPPADRGAVHRVLGSGPRVIVLVDGVFHGSPSVWQRELLDALDEGVTVVGAASMGALRAAELQPFGMIGCGRVFRWYRDGRIEGDDEVALLHGDAESGYRAMSEPLVNIRATLCAATSAGRISAGVARDLLERARAAYYADRGWRALLRGSGEQVAQAVRDCRVDVKRADARVALRTAARILAGEASAALPSMPVRSSLWAPARVLQATVPGPAGPVETIEILRRAREERPDAVRAARERVSRRFFVADWACRHGVVGPPADDAGPRRVDGLSAITHRRLAVERARAEWVAERADALLGPDHWPLPPGGRADRFVVAWAREAGVCPGPPASRDERDALCRWVVEQGPRYFGMWWSEDAAVIEELQLTGMAAELAGCPS